MKILDYIFSEFYFLKQKEVPMLSELYNFNVYKIIIHCDYGFIID